MQNRVAALFILLFVKYTRSSLPKWFYTRPVFLPVFFRFFMFFRSFVGVGAAWRLRGPAAAMRASVGAVIPLLRGAPLGATAGRRGAGFFMATDCRTADGGDVVTADRTPRSAAASRRPCLDRSSPCWRRDKARQDEAKRPGD